MALKRRRKKPNLHRVRVSPVSVVIIIGLLLLFFAKVHKVLRHNSKTLKALFPKPGTENYRIRPLGCRLFLKGVKLGRNVKDPNHGELVLVRGTNETFSVSIHKRVVDSHMKGYSIRETGTYYQTKTTDLIKDILRNATAEARVIEVGASFGWFSLLAHKQGLKVDVFEPNLVNVLRLCQSLDANHWFDDGLDIYPYGMTAEDGEVLFQYHDDGTARINDNWGHKAQAFALDSFARERGWLERSDEIIAILKIDVGNHVPQVMAGASELLSSGMVKSLILDLTIRHKGDKEQCMDTIQQVMDAGFELELWGDNELGPAYPSPWQHTAELPTDIIRAMERPKHQKGLTFYWKYKEE
jgi:FkbM family methyltransferase